MFSFFKSNQKYKVKLCKTCNHGGTVTYPLGEYDKVAHKVVIVGNKLFRCPDCHGFMITGVPELLKIPIDKADRMFGEKTLSDIIQIFNDKTPKEVEAILSASDLQKPIISR